MFLARLWIKIIVTILLIIVALWYYSLSGIHCEIPLQKFYTHIVVGAGTAGCVLAARLSENNNNSVLLVEAGATFGVFSKFPILSVFLQRSVYDWSYETETQKWSSKGFINQVQFMPRGKGLGGSGQINFMVHGFLGSEHFKHWDLINVNLKKHIFKYYKQLKFPYYQVGDKCDYKENLFFNKKFTQGHSFQISQKIHYPFHYKTLYSELSQSLKEATKELHNLKLQFKTSRTTIHNGERWSTFYSHLKPSFPRKNLHILCNTEVTKIIFKNSRAMGIQIANLNATKKIIFSYQDIIISAGSINTPKLLMLSGVGNSTDLKLKGISLVLDKPEVGQNLHDHINMPLHISLEKPLSVTLDKILNLKEIWKYVVYRKGIFSEIPIKGILQDFESNVNVVLLGLGLINEKFRSIGNYKHEIFRTLFPLNQESFIFLAGCAEPISRGFVRLKNSNYHSHPLIDPQYLKESNDIECMKRAVRMAAEIINTKSFKDLGAQIHWPLFKECLPTDPSSDRYLECIIRISGITGYHPAGTCKIGKTNDSSAVTNDKFMIDGISNLRIVDSSVLPTPAFAFPNSMLVAIAEYAAEIIMSK